jgi:DNA anti-recombination protein RmuC
MTQPQNNERAELTKLMRSIAREVAYQVLDEHLEDYEHKPKTPDIAELES